MLSRKTKVVYVFVSAALLWLGRWGIASLTDRNANFSVEGVVIDIRGDVVKGATICTASVSRIFLKSSMDESIFKSEDGRFKAAVNGVGEFWIYAATRGGRQSHRVQVSKTETPRFDWLGRRVYRASNLTLVLKEEMPTTLPSSALSRP